jgi:hypothetical protein
MHYCLVVMAIRDLTTSCREIAEPTRTGFICSIFHEASSDCHFHVIVLNEGIRKEEQE